jgi:hypothetical protein
MKTSQGSGLKIILLLLLSCPLAQGGWLDKGVSVFKSLGGTGGTETPSTAEIGNAFKEALRIGSEQVTGQLGVTDGFNADPAIHIPLPEKLNTGKTMLAKVGMSKAVDDLELKLNRAAEAATPQAKKLFAEAIRNMTFDDVKRIYSGPDDAATQYFREKMSPELSRQMQPIAEASLAEVGAVQAYDNVMRKYSSLPFVPDVKANLTDHVVQKGMDGIFFYLAKEEAAIRKDPLKQTTALLKKVFGSK